MEFTFSFNHKPVVAYRYIDNYLPQAYNITGTLKEDSENVFTFVYTFIPEAGIITNYTVIELPGVVIDLGTIVIEGDGGGPVPPVPPVEEDIPDPEIPQGGGIMRMIRGIPMIRKIRLISMKTIHLWAERVTGMKKTMEGTTDSLPSGTGTLSGLLCQFLCW